MTDTTAGAAIHIIDLRFTRCFALIRSRDIEGGR